MLLDHYDLDANADFTVFRFSSSGPQGRIVKEIQLSPINLPAQGFTPGPTVGLTVYNLGFGDYQAGHPPDDKVVSNNGDRDKVLTTVAGATYEFCYRYPRRWVFARGSTPARTRLYQMSLNRFHADIVGDFELFGYLALAKKWGVFQKDASYAAFAAFLIRLK